MNIGNQISNIRKEKQLTQEEFGRLFHVTRQTVSNWENGKSYPDLQILVDMSNQFEISRYILFIFSRFHNADSNSYSWTCNDRNWLV